MKIAFLLALIPLAAPGAPAPSASPAPAGNAAAPARLPFARYDEMIKKSPFAPATPVTPVEAKASFTANYYASGVARIGGKDFVTIVARDGQSRFSLAPGEQGPDGITVKSVEWSDELGKSKVVMKKGEETGVIQFDQAAMQRPIIAVPEVANGPTVRTPFPATGQPVLGRPAVPAPAAVRQVSPIPGGDTRRRIRIINSPPAQ